jgi:hypothetical protein
MADELDLDLIHRVQQARRQFDAGAQPSQVGSVYWIEAHRETEGAPPTVRAGQWVLVTDVASVDAVWEQIRQATREGRLGYKSKVTTAPRELGTNRADRLICVVTADAEDAADVERVRTALADLNLPPLRYERLNETSAKME